MRAGSGLFWVACCLTALRAQSPASEMRSTLRGQVVDGLTGQPLTNVEVQLEDADWQSAARPVTPDAQGRFAFARLKPGEYILSVSRPDLGTVFFDELPDPGSVQSIHIKPGQPERTVLFRVLPRSAIAGTVRDDFSEPMEWISVTLYRAVWGDGRIRFEPTQQVSTDDRGRFRIGALAPGGYYVCAAADVLGAGAAAAAGAGTVDFASRGEPRYYLQTCLPEPGGAAGRPLEVLPGRQQEVELRLHTSPGATLKGRVSNLPQGIEAGVQMIREGLGGNQARMFGSDPMDGTFTLHGVGPGKYHLESQLDLPPVDGPPVHLVARLPVEVAGGSIENIELALEPPAVVDIAIHGIDGVAPKQMMLGLRSEWGTTWTEREGTGPLHFPTLTNDRYWLVTRSDSHTCVEAAKLGEQDALRGPVTVSAGTNRLDVTLSSRCGSIQARAVAGGKPVPDAKVVLLLSGSAKDPGNLLQGFADDEGESYLDGLAPGRYRLWAWGVDRAGAFAGPPSLADASEKATEVVVTAGAPVKIDVPVIPPEGQ